MESRATGAVLPNPAETKFLCFPRACCNVPCRTVPSRSAPRNACMRARMPIPVRACVRAWSCVPPLAYIVMAYLVMAYLVMAYIVMAYPVMAYVVMVCTTAGPDQRHE